MRPVRNRHYVWCDFHCAIHETKWDVYEEEGDRNWSKEPPACNPANWRAVYVLGEKGEFDG